MLKIAEKILSEMICFYRVDEPLKINKKDIEVMEWLIEEAKKVERYEKVLKEIAIHCSTTPFNHIAKQALEGEE